MSRLYRHALESIFAFSDILTLIHIRAVCKAWRAATSTMAPVSAYLCMIGKIRRPPPEITRHVTNLRISVAKAGKNRPNFRTFPRLWSFEYIGPTQVLKLPMTLIRVDIHIRGKTDGNLNMLRNLHNLMTISIQFEKENVAIDYTVFASMPHLHTLSIRGHTPNLKPDDIQALRALQSLRTCDIIVSDMLTLLQKPHTLQWERVCDFFPIDDEETACALSTLPLTELSVLGYAYFHPIRTLRSLRLAMFSGTVQLWSHIVDAIGQCINLVTLDVYWYNDLSLVLPMLRNLRMLQTFTLTSDEFYYVPDLFPSPAPPIQMVELIGHYYDELPIIPTRVFQPILNTLQTLSLIRTDAEHDIPGVRITRTSKEL